MNAEELGIARRLVACKGWVWIPGMVNEDGARFVCMEGVRKHRFWGPTRGKWHLIIGTPFPDISDELTRLGVLAVVRRAWGDDSIGITKAGDEWAVTMAYVEIVSGDARMSILRRGPTELAALLAALEAAP